MIGIDTNILVRYLTQDDAQQALIASKFITAYEGKVHSLFISNVVLCELIWVLERGYNYTKKEIIHVMRNILSTLEFAFEYFEILWLSIVEYEITSADFSDILIGKIGEHKGCNYTITFDIKASQLSEFKNANGI